MFIANMPITATPRTMSRAAMRGGGSVAAVIRIPLPNGLVKAGVYRIRRFVQPRPRFALPAHPALFLRRGAEPFLREGAKAQRHDVAKIAAASRWGPGKRHDPGRRQSSAGFDW